VTDFCKLSPTNSYKPLKHRKKQRDQVVDVRKDVMSFVYFGHIKFHKNRTGSVQFKNNFYKKKVLLDTVWGRIH
jgi:hypothetical protein